MKKLANYIIFKELEVIVECYKGTMIAEDGINHKKAMIQDADFDAAFNIITDLRETDIHVKGNSIDEITTFVNFLRETPVPLKVALITDKPNQAALAHLFKEFGKATIIEYEVFSTIPAAIKYVGLKAGTYDLIHEALLKLSRTTSA